MRIYQVSNQVIIATEGNVQLVSVPIQDSAMTLYTDEVAINIGVNGRQVARVKYTEIMNSGGSLVGNKTAAILYLSGFISSGSSYPAADSVKVGFISITQPVNLDTMSTRLANTSGTNTGDQDLSGKEDKINKGTANGYAELGADGKIPASQLPAGTDEVQEYANLAAFPATGSSSVIYVAIDTGTTYRWGGTVYVEISASLALGETSATAYRGDRGKIAYDHSQVAHAPADAADDQTGAEIKVLYEAELDTNAYTDAEVTKLGKAIISDATQGGTGSVALTNMVEITQAAYDLLTPDADTWYLING